MLNSKKNYQGLKNNKFLFFFFSIIKKRLREMSIFGSNLVTKALKNSD